ncbi:hypothetical protein G6F46_014312 [Rhizopus delemar]|nr:hypothetical protein G6F46_014312 [Rhizopus delemar]
MLLFGIAVRTRQQGQVGIDRAQLGQRLAGFQRLRNRQHRDLRAFGVRLGQHPVGGGTATARRQAPPARHGRAAPAPVRCQRGHNRSRWRGHAGPGTGRWLLPARAAVATAPAWPASGPAGRTPAG